MKSKVFNTSKGEFLIVDLPGKGNTETICLLSDLKYKIVGPVKLITEEQASDIMVSEYVFTPGENVEHWNLYKNYEDNSLSWSFTALDSLHSLIKSLGIHLYENPFGNYKDFEGKMDLYMNILSEEQNTLYNPYIWKKI